MNVNLSTEQLDSLLTVLQHVLDTELTSYEDWCDRGNDPTDHIWYHAAGLDATFTGEQA